MDFINQPIVETLPVIWNKLCQFFIWLFADSPDDKTDFYKALLFCMLSLPIVDIYQIFTSRENIFYTFLGVIISNIIVVAGMVAFIELCF